MPSSCEAIKKNYSFMRYMGPLNLRDLKVFMGKNLIVEKDLNHISHLYWIQSSRKIQIAIDDLIVKIAPSIFHIYTDEEFCAIYNIICKEDFK